MAIKWVSNVTSVEHTRREVFERLKECAVGRVGCQKKLLVLRERTIFADLRNRKFPSIVCCDAPDEVIA